MARKGQFKKGGGRVGHASASKPRKHRARRASSVAMTAPATRTVYRTRSAPRRATRSRRRSKGSGMPKLLHLAGAAAVLAYATTPGKGPAVITNTVAKIPGAATFGNPAVVGLAALAIDRFVKPNRYLKLLGAAGIVLAAAKVGTAGTEFKFVGDEGDYTGDIGDDDDVGDYDDVGDDED